MSGCCAKPKPKPKPKPKRIPSRREIVRRKKRSKERKKERARKRDRDFLDMLADKSGGVDGVLEKIGDALRKCKTPKGLVVEVFNLPAKDAHRLFDDDDAIEVKLEEWAESMFGAADEVLNEKGWRVDRAVVVREFIGRMRRSSMTGERLPRKTKSFRVIFYVGAFDPETESSGGGSSSQSSQSSQSSSFGTTATF